MNGEAVAEQRQREQPPAGQVPRNTNEPAPRRAARPSLLSVPRFGYCRRCNRTEEFYKLSQLIHYKPNELIYVRVHLMLDCGHPPAAPYDRWEETSIISMEQLPQRRFPAALAEN